MRYPQLACFLSSFLCFASVVQSAEQPNFVVVMGDDVGWDAFGYAGTKAARTPNIDRLAEQSCYMTRFYCSVSQCAPLRAELYTNDFQRSSFLAKGHRDIGVQVDLESRPGERAHLE